MQSLEDLKKENAQEEKNPKKEESKEESSHDEPEQESTGDDSEQSEQVDESADESGESEGEDSEETETVDNDAWLKPEEDEPQGERVNDHEAKLIRQKWKGQARQKDAENAELRQKLAELEKKISTPTIQPTKEKPKREAFKTDAEYTSALVTYEIEIGQQRVLSERQAEEIAQRKAQHKLKLDADVEAHYIRAAALSEKSKISDQTYKAADTAFRNACESVYPDLGDNIADTLISSLGAGSEKVTYNIGISPARQAKFIQLLKDDPSGIKAASFLGELKHSLNAPVKRESKAPAPPEKIQGDKAGGKGGAEKLRKDYQAAHAKHDIQKALDIKRAAKQRGLSTKGW